MASRLPLTFVESRYFGASVGSDYFSGKGVVGVGVEVSSSEEVQIFTTHVQADMGAADPLRCFVMGEGGKDVQTRKVRNKQFAVIRDFLKQRGDESNNVDNKYKVVGRIIAGDFNVIGEDLTMVTESGDSRSDDDEYVGKRTRP